MTSPNFLRILAGVGIGLAVLFSFVALILSAETLRKINNTNDAITGATRLGSKGGKGPSTAVIADYVWKYGEAPSAECGDCVSSTLLAGQHTPSGTVRSLVTFLSLRSPVQDLQQRHSSLGDR